MSKLDKITLDINVPTQELVIREGKALDPKDPLSVKLVGVLDSPLRWLEKRTSVIDQKQCHILVDRNDMRISLIMDERNYYRDNVTGALEVHPLFKKFGINRGEYITNFEMATLFKMNRSAFDNQVEAMKLVSELQNFRAKVEKEIERKDDTRGNKRDLLAQTVASNLPETFILKMPIFKGMEKRSFEVEVYIRAEDYCCTLVSPVANDIVAEISDTEIDKVIAEIRKLCPDIAIIEI